jgi:hypothetical protein
VIHMARSVLAVPALSGCFWRAKCKHACRTCCFEAVSCSPSSSELIGPTTIASKRNTPTLSVIVTIYMWLGYHIAHDLKWRYISSKSQCVAAHTGRCFLSHKNPSNTQKLLYVQFLITTKVIGSKFFVQADPLRYS